VLQVQKVIQNFQRFDWPRLGIIPILVYLLTFSLPLLHLTHSRIYNYRVALLELIIVIAAFIVYRGKLWLHFSRSIGWVLGLFLVSGLISAIQSEFPRFAFQRYLSVGLWIAYFWLLVFLLRNREIGRRALIVTASLSCLIPVMTLFYYYRDGVDVYALVSQLYYYSNIRHFGYHLTAVVIFSLYFFIGKNVGTGRLITGALIYFSHLFLLFWTESRQGFFIALLATWVIVFFYLRRKNHRYLFLFGLVMASAAIWLLKQGGESGIFRGLASFPTTFAEFNAFSSGRLEIWRDTVNQLQGHWLFGQGPESFIFLFPDIIYVHPHSFPLHSLLEWGLVGSIFLFWICLRLSVAALKRVGLFERSPKAEVVAGLLVLVYLVNSLVDGIFYHVLPIYFFSLAAAILWAGNTTDVLGVDGLPDAPGKTGQD
jgi:hypothetical protein